MIDGERNNHLEHASRDDWLDGRVGIKRFGVAVQRTFVCEVQDQIVVATLQGQPTEAVLEECQNKILSLICGSGIRAVLYDFRQLSVAPPAKVLLHQEALDQETRALKLRRAVVVPTAFIGYLARLAFSADGCLVFLNDYAAAVRFLSRGNPFWPAWSVAVDDERRVRERRCEVDRSRKEIAKHRTDPKLS